VEIPPPHFQGFVSLALLMGIPFGVFMGGATLVWTFGFVQARAMALENAYLVALLGTLLTGAPFGLLMTGYFRLSARYWKLPSWGQYPPIEPDAASDRNDPRELE
jgi:hypothetical protein